MWKETMQLTLEIVGYLLALATVGHFAYECSYLKKQLEILNERQRRTLDHIYNLEKKLPSYENR